MLASVGDGWAPWVRARQAGRTLSAAASLPLVHQNAKRPPCTEEVHLRVFSGEEKPVVERLAELLADSEYLSQGGRPVTGLDERHVGPVG